MKAILSPPLRLAQKGAKRISIGLVVAAAILLYHNAAAIPIPVDLGSASNFAVLAGSAITVAGAATITGNIGTYPTTTITGLGNITFLSGSNQAGDALTQQAKTDLLAAYNNAAGCSPTTVYAPVFNLGGLILTNGVYYDSTSFDITGTLTLDAGGNPNAVWIFQAGSTLGLESGSQVVLTNGAQAANVFWQVGSSATLNSTCILQGNILALTSITLVTGATVDGRVLALNGAVTLDNNTISLPVQNDGSSGYTWTDGTGNFSNPSNWVTGEIPPVGLTNEVLYFGGSTNGIYTANNDLGNLLTKRVVLSNNVAAVTQ